LTSPPEDVLIIKNHTYLHGKEQPLLTEQDIEQRAYCFEDVRKRK
jgi:hypothetical protein